MSSPKSPPIRLVLLRPRNPENLGAVARAMKNCGLSDWAIVDPRTHDFAAARRVAVHAEELLDRPQLTSTLDEAVADCVWVVGTSSRAVKGKRRLAPREVAAEAFTRGGKVAIVFGDERSGLTNEEIDRCHDLSVVPTDPAQPSINLAQAALLYAYEVRLAALSLEERAPGLLPVAATDDELTRVEDSLRKALRQGGFLKKEERHAIRDLVAPLRRSRLTKKEARLWASAMLKLAASFSDVE